jgi:tetratricopeptide (TPR) repeat protein
MLAAALANAYLVSPDDPAEVESIRAIAERALALAPDDALVLSSVGLALCFLGYPEEGVRHTGRAVRKAPGSGLLHYQHGAACVMLYRPEEALSHLKTAERLMPGSHLMWAVKSWLPAAYRDQSRWAEADATADEAISLLPAWPYNYVFKAVYSLKLGRDAEARRHIEKARRLGLELAEAERFWRRCAPNSPALEDIATIRALYAATEPGA